MAEVDHSLPEDMTEAEAKQKIKEYVDAKWTALAVEMQEAKDEIKAAHAALRAETQAAIQNCVKYGENVAVTADQGKGMLLCAQDGGPKESGQDFRLTSRTAVGPHESWKVSRGQA